MEMLVVIGIASLAALSGIGVVLDYQKQSDVANAITKARKIAYAMDFLRHLNLGMVLPSHEISLRQFRDALISIDPDLPSRYISMLDDNEQVLGIHVLDFYRISATQYSVFVSFDLDAADYGDIQFDRTVTHLNAETGRVTWTVMQSIENGIGHTYATINGLYAN